jgi:hypothetical protein
MKRLPSLAIALLAALAVAPAWADSATAQDTPQTPQTGQLTTPERTAPRELDALVVTGATDDADGQRWAAKDDAVPEISDSDWVPAQSD